MLPQAESAEYLMGVASGHGKPCRSSSCCRVDTPFWLWMLYLYVYTSQCRLRMVQQPGCHCSLPPHLAGGREVVWQWLAACGAWRGGLLESAECAC